MNNQFTGSRLSKIAVSGLVWGCHIVTTVKIQKKFLIKE